MGRSGNSPRKPWSRTSGFKPGFWAFSSKVRANRSPCASIRSTPSMSGIISTSVKPLLAFLLLFFTTKDGRSTKERKAASPCCAKSPTDKCQIPEGASPFITAQNLNASGQNPVHLCRQCFHRAAGDQPELHNFTLAGESQGKRERDGHIRMGMKPCRMPNGNTCPQESPLHGVHEVQMRDVLGRTVFGKQNSLLRHDRFPPHTAGLHRSRNISYGSSVLLLHSLHDSTLVSGILLLRRYR